MPLAHGASSLGFSWQLGFIIGPATGGAVLGAEPLALWPIMAGLSLVGALYALRLERILPAKVRRNPRREALEEIDVGLTVERVLRLRQVWSAIV